MTSDCLWEVVVHTPWVCSRVWTIRVWLPQTFLTWRPGQAALTLGAHWESRRGVGLPGAGRQALGLPRLCWKVGCAP